MSTPASRIAEESSASSASAAAPASPPPPPLYRHALECVFSFASLAELSRWITVCSLWRAAVGSMRSLRRVLFGAWTDDAFVARAARSGLVRHFFAVQAYPRNSSQCWPLSVGTVRLLAERMPQLESLFFSLDAASPALAAVIFPPQLRTLHLHLSRTEQTIPAHLPRLLGAIAACRSLSRLLLAYPSEKLPPVDFTPLARLSDLRELEIRGPLELTDAQVWQLRALTQLHVLCASLSAANLADLVAPPHALQLREFFPAFLLSDAMSPLLARLPSLTRVDGDIFGGARVDVLAELPNLTDVKFAFVNPMQRDVTHVLDTLQRCTALTSLRMGVHSPKHISSAELEALLPCLPHLARLSVDSRSALGSLACLSTAAAPHLARTLTALDLTFLDMHELALQEEGQRALFALTALNNLVLGNQGPHADPAVVGPRKQALQAIFQPPCAQLPRLTRFFAAAH